MPEVRQYGSTKQFIGALTPSDGSSCLRHDRLKTPKLNDDSFKTWLSGRAGQRRSALEDVDFRFSIQQRTTMLVCPGRNHPTSKGGNAECLCWTATLHLEDRQ